MGEQQGSIIPCFMGGLGNQLFIMAAAYVVHKINDIPLFILKTLTSNNKHNIHNFDYIHTIFYYLGNHINVSQDMDTLITQLLLMGYKDQVNMAQNAFAPWSPIATHTKLLIRNYCQYYPNVKEIEEEFTNLCLKGLERHSNQPPPIDSATSAFLHIRRGDYLTHQDIYYIQPLEYYKKAVTLLKEKNPSVQTIYILSDDIQWVNQQDMFRDSIFKIYESSDELQSFLFMTKCHAGAIIANSTFSWWGALMGCHRLNAPVMYPYRWISLPIYDLFPSTWTSIVY